jgi:hypothetical protein
MGAGIVTESGLSAETRAAVERLKAVFENRRVARMTAEARRVVASSSADADAETGASTSTDAAVAAGARAYNGVHSPWACTDIFTWLNGLAAAAGIGAYIAAAGPLVDDAGLYAACGADGTPCGGSGDNRLRPVRTEIRKDRSQRMWYVACVFTCIAARRTD